jgi:hypothetical protein
MKRMTVIAVAAAAGVDAYVAYASGESNAQKSNQSRRDAS